MNDSDEKRIKIWKRKSILLLLLLANSLSQITIRYGGCKANSESFYLTLFYTPFADPSAPCTLANFICIEASSTPSTYFTTHIDRTRHTLSPPISEKWSGCPVNKYTCTQRTYCAYIILFFASPTPASLHMNSGKQNPPGFCTIKLHQVCIFTQPP